MNNHNLPMDPLKLGILLAVIILFGGFFLKLIWLAVVISLIILIASALLKR